MLCLYTNDTIGHRARFYAESKGLIAAKRKRRCHCPNRNRKQFCFTWSLSPSYGGRSAETLHCKRKRKTGKRESDGNRGKTRVTGRAFTQQKALVLSLNLSLLLRMCFLERDIWKTAFFLLDQWVIRPNCFLQLGVLLCLFMALRSGFLGQLVILLTGGGLKSCLHPL